jgi:hypothetical protein
MSEVELDPNSSVVHLAISILCAGRNSLILELLYVLSPTQIAKFMKIYAGETIKIPTIAEFRYDILAALAYVHVHKEGKSFDWFEIKYGLDGNSVRSVRKRLERWKSQLSDNEADFLGKDKNS